MWQGDATLGSILDEKMPKGANLEGWPSPKVIIFQWVSRAKFPTAEDDTLHHPPTGTSFVEHCFLESGIPLSGFQQ